MKPPFISIIVPIYKVEAHLQECIDSILAQTFTDFELILVNDGSPDNCGAICDANAAKDSRIRVIHQKNQGVTRARANGVAAAKGVFINFVDGDDTLPPHSLATLTEHANEETDVVLGTEELPNCQPEGEISSEQYREIVICHKSFSYVPFAKLFRRSLFDESIFDIPADIIMGEDLIMNHLLAYKVKGKVYSTYAEVYSYRKTPYSVMNTRHPLKEKIKCQEYRIKVISPEDLKCFLPKGLAQDLINHWFKHTRSQINIPADIREYHQYLRSIIKYTDIQFGPLAHLLFHCTNPLIRAIIVPLYRAINTVRGRR